MYQQNGVRIMRRALQLKQQELSVRAGISPAELVLIEKYHHLPGEEVRGKLSQAMGVSESMLWPELEPVTEAR